MTIFTVLRQTQRYLDANVVERKHLSAMAVRTSRILEPYLDFEETKTKVMIKAGGDICEQINVSDFMDGLTDAFGRGIDLNAVLTTIDELVDDLVGVFGGSIDLDKTKADTTKAQDSADL